jgi:hypothetical protein
VKAEAMCDEKLDTEEFCRLVNERFKSLTGYDVFPETILEAMGGISNLYCEAAIQTDGLLETETYQTFASTRVPITEIIEEIRNCTGLKLDQAVTVLDCMEAVLREEIKQRGLMAITLVPLGTFVVINRDRYTREFHLTYEDPARKDYDAFLLRSRGE